MALTHIELGQIAAANQGNSKNTERKQRVGNNRKRTVMTKTKRGVKVEAVALGLVFD